MRPLRRSITRLGITTAAVLMAHVLMVHALLSGDWRVTPPTEQQEPSQVLTVLPVTPLPTPQPTHQPTPKHSPDPAPDVFALRPPDPPESPLVAEPLEPAVPDADRPYTDAPAAPSAEDWALAGRYTLKNSKRYRYNWGLQVRSLMGRVVEGPEQGVVRFRIEVAPNGHLSSVETLWATSPEVEARARQAIVQMPPLPPTPTGEPLVFERTIAFQVGALDAPPLYRNDCLPDPPAFRNAFAWDGKSEQRVAAAPAAARPLDAAQLAECLKQLPPDTIEAESAHDQRQLEQWTSSRLQAP